ncbi:MAG: hypothetical protein SFV52_11530 [Saprospiraceae bacterium]|nr:hypothetical protein [Saprospiraceae bacterium]
MRNLYFFALLAGLLLPAGSWGQPGFNRTYDFGYPVHETYKLVVKNDTIVMYGLARQDTSPFQQCLFLARFDSIGQPVDHKLICDPNGGTYTAGINWSSIISTSDGGFALTAGSFEANDGMLVKLRYDLSIEFSTVFFDTSNLVEFYRYIIEQSDGYILIGYVVDPEKPLTPLFSQP